MKKELLEINEMVRGDEIAEKIMSDLLDVYYKRERIGEFRKKLIHFSKPLLIIIAEALNLNDHEFAELCGYKNDK